MFGYIKTDTPNIYIKDEILYKAMYCGLCKGIGKTCGTRARFCLNYDLTFLSLLCHNILNIDVKVEKEHCYIHWLKKRPIASVDELTEKIARLNIILAYNKIKDDVIDNNKGRLKRAFFKKAYRLAKKEEPELNAIVENRYNELLELEKNNCDSFDIIADPFGKMMQEVFKEIIKDKFNEDFAMLSYSIGKWIYLIDAIDDFDKDIKNNDYNVFILNKKECQTKKEYISKNASDLQLLFGTIISDIISYSDKIDYKFNHDLLDNILKKGIFKQTKIILEEKNEKEL